MQREALVKPHLNLWRVVQYYNDGTTRIILETRDLDGVCKQVSETSA
jgi:hypothetical protein